MGRGRVSTYTVGPCFVDMPVTCFKCSFNGSFHVGRVSFPDTWVLTRQPKNIKLVNQETDREQPRVSCPQKGG